jgi:acyl carrier protein
MRDTFFVEEIAENDSFLESGLVDSTGMIELVAFVQSAFGIRIDDAELLPENLDSLSKLVGFIERKRSGAAGA